MEKTEIVQVSYRTATESGHKRHYKYKCQYKKKNDTQYTDE
jgi:hypothetical protein